MGRPFRSAGNISPNTYLHNYKTGDYVDIVVNSGARGAIPHKTYHGRTGVVWNVTGRALGVEINKQILGRILRKRIHVRIEHLRPSKCRLDFINRVKENLRLKKKSTPKMKILTRRKPKTPNEACKVI